MKTKYIVIIVAIVLVIILFFRIGYLISPGSYPESENYIINSPQNILLNKIDSIKLHDTRYNVPALTNRYDSIKHSYNVYIYNFNKNQIIHIETQSKSNKQSIIHFIGINQGLTLGNWKMVNKDFSNEENEILLSDFEKNVLNQLGISFKRE